MCRLALLFSLRLRRWSKMFTPHTLQNLARLSIYTRKQPRHTWVIASVSHFCGEGLKFQCAVRNPVHRPDPLPARAAQLKGEGSGNETTHELVSWRPHPSDYVHALSAYHFLPAVFHPALSLWSSLSVMTHITHSGLSLFFKGSVAVYKG